MKTPWPLVDQLVQRFGLNACEKADLSSWAEWLTLEGGVEAIARETGREAPPTEEDVRAHLFMRAEVLSIFGSHHQEMYDALKDASGRDWGYGELMA